jgi:hypothetical protein
LDTVIGKLTAAGFTIIASKCSFCRREITFLGHIISNKGQTPRGTFEGHHKPYQTACKSNRWKILGEKGRLLCKDSSVTLSGDPLSRRRLPQNCNKSIQDRTIVVLKLIYNASTSSKEAIETTV